MTSPGTCPFCKIVRGQDPEVREVWRDDNLIAFFPREPAVLGHMMLIPTQHRETIWDLGQEMARGLSTTILWLSHVIKDALDPDGLNIIQSNGEAATQSVPHLHVHLVPRWDVDAMPNIWPDETSYAESEKDEVLRLLVTRVDKDRHE